MNSLEENTIQVYIKINDNNEIVEVNSSVFLNNVDGFIKIDEGKGDKYAHAQTHYFDKPLYFFEKEMIKYNYKYENGKVFEII